jgi:hypothetical protein
VNGGNALVTMLDQGALDQLQGNYDAAEAAYLVGSLWLAVLIVGYIETKARFQLNTRWPFLARRSREL